MSENQSLNSKQNREHLIIKKKLRKEALNNRDNDTNTNLWLSQ